MARTLGGSNDSDPMVFHYSRENLPLGVSKQQRRRPACELVQSDPCLCYLLIGKYIKTCYQGHFTILAVLCG